MASLIDDYLEKNKAKSPISTASVVNPAQQNEPTPDSSASNVQSYISRTLEGKNPIVQNAQAQQNTASAVQKYIADRSAKNTSAQAGFDPGTLQYQRTQDRAAAAADQSILQGQNQVNDLTRQTSQQALSDKSSLDASAIQSVEDPRARAYLQSVLASGGDVQSALAEMYEGGVLKPEYASPTAGEQLRLDAEDIVKNLYPDLVPGTPEFEAAVNERLQNADKATQEPIVGAVTDAQIADVQQKARTGQRLTDDEVEVLANSTDVVYAAQLPSNATQIEAAKSNNPFVKLEDGNVYQIMGYNQQTTDRNTGIGKSNRHDDWTVLKDLSTGKTVYVRDDGVMIDYKPPIPSERAKSVRYENGVWVETYASSGGRTGKVYDPATGKWVRR